MKRLILLFFIALIVNLAHGQYNEYEDQTNLRGQRIIKTADGGFFIVAIEDCYTPGSITIEGCIYALHLVKTTSTGDTIWTNTIGYHTQVEAGIHLFENNDGTFSIIARTNHNYFCDGVFVGLFGFTQINIINLSATGQVLSDIEFPDNCSLRMEDVERLSDHLYAVAATYESLISNQIEGRLFLMDGNGLISNELTFFNQELKDANLIKKGANELLLLYIRDSETLKMETYDFQLNFITEVSDPDNSNTCLSEYNIDMDAKLLNNGEIGILCHKRLEDVENLQFFRYDNSLDLLTDNVFTLQQPTNFIELDDGSLNIASVNSNFDTTLNMQINHFSAMGDSLSSVVIAYPGDQRPEQIINVSDSDYAIVGNVNCCNMDTTIGPGKSFLFLKNLKTNLKTTEIEKIKVNVFPNPAKSHVFFEVEDDDFYTGKYVLRTYTAIGKLLNVKKLDSSSTKIPLKNIADGLIFYTLTKDGIFQKSGKILINHD